MVFQLENGDGIWAMGWGGCLEAGVGFCNSG